MKLKEIFNRIRKVAKPEKQERVIDKEDMFATIKHKTQSIGFRSMANHNNRKNTRGRHIQYVTVNGITKPIYHTGY